jgi:REP element-mobilizing transposase RayT
MSSSKRLYYNRATYHVCIRGNNRQMVLNTEEDKKKFLETLNKFKNRFAFKLFGLVLMDNHVHLVIQVNGLANISKIMQAVTLSYSQKFRHKYGYTGYVWQGRFKSSVIEGNSYIVECLNYIHNNPLRAKIVNKLQDYLWSSYHVYQNNKNPLEEFISIDRFTYSY